MGKTYPPFLSPEFIISKDFPLEHSTGRVPEPSLELPGYVVDATQAHRKAYQDHIPATLPPSEQGSGKARISGGGHQGTVVLRDGTYLCSCTRPKQASR